MRAKKRKIKKRACCNRPVWIKDKKIVDCSAHPDQPFPALNGFGADTFYPIQLLQAGKGAVFLTVLQNSPCLDLPDTGKQTKRFQIRLIQINPGRSLQLSAHFRQRNKIPLIYRHQKKQSPCLLYTSRCV